MKRLIQVFAKVPVLGTVKTRLAHDVGDVAALEIHKKLCEKVILTAQSTQGAAYEIWYSGSDPGYFRQYGAPLKEQQGSDLGQRMSNAIQSGLTRSEQVVVVGGDVYSIRSIDFIHAFQGLDSASVVVAPALDGGYVMLGCTRVEPSIFIDIPWGTDQVFNLTVERLRLASINVQLLELGYDIDCYDDLLRWAPELIAGL